MYLTRLKKCHQSYTFFLLYPIRHLIIELSKTNIFHVKQEKTKPVLFSASSFKKNDRRNKLMMKSYCLIAFTS